MSSHLTEEQKAQHCETGNRYFQDKIGELTFVCAYRHLQHLENCDDERWLCF